MRIAVRRAVVFVAVFLATGSGRAEEVENASEELHPLAPIATLEGHESLVRCLAFRPDGEVLASGASDRTLRLWMAPDWKPGPSLTLPRTSG